MGINVNAICPGFYRTNLGGGSDDPDFVQAVREFVPMGKMAEPEDLKGTAIYLASEASDRQVPRKPRLVGGIERPNGSRGTIKNDVSLARILLATACPGSRALWAGSFTICVVK